MDSWKGWDETLSLVLPGTAPVMDQPKPTIAERVRMVVVAARDHFQGSK